MSQRDTWKRRAAGLCVMALGIVVFPFVVSNPYYLNVVNIIGLNAIIVVGLNLLIGYAGQISLGHAAFFGLGAYASGILTVTYGISPWSAMVVSVCFTALVALLIGVPTLKLHGHYLVMGTLGFNFIVNILLVQWSDMTGGPSGFSGIPSLAVGSFTFATDRKMFYLIWSVLLVCILLALNLVDSRSGRGLRALRGSEVAAGCLGVPTKRYKVKIFVVSAVYASIAGSLYAHYLNFVSPKTFDIFFSIELVTMVIVGGMGSIWGGLFGTAFLTSLPNLLHYFDEYKDIFYGLILVVILIFLPEGLLVGLWNKIRFRQQPPAPELPAVAGHDEAREQTAAARAHPRDRTVSRALPDPILSVRNVSVGFGGVVALAQVSFDLPEGLVTAVIGPNGAGKTTLINAISAVQPVLKGSIVFDDTDTTKARPHQMAGLGLTRTFQNIQVFEHMSVLENVKVGMHARGRHELLSSMIRAPGFREEEKKIEDRAWEVLQFFGLEALGKLPVESLPYGMQKRVEMARAIAPMPRLVLLDEPVAGLNMTESRRIAQLIDRLRTAGITILLVEHDMNLVMGISDRIVVLNYGRKICEGDPQAVQRDPQVLAAYLGSGD